LLPILEYEVGDIIIVSRFSQPTRFVWRVRLQVGCGP
jgi:hypothetical protein